MEIVVWVLSIQLWSDPPPRNQLIYNKEYPTYNECMEARKEWERTNFKAFCLMKVKKP